MSAIVNAEGIKGDRDIIEQVVRDSIGWALNKDRDLLLGLMAHDPDFFIFHPDSGSTIVGYDAFEEMVDRVFMNEAFRATGFAVRDMRINLSQCGTVAWYSAVLDDHGEWNGRSSSWIDTRWTGVLEKRDGSWQIVQMHFSFAADKE